MDKILEQVTIKINWKMQEKYLAQVTLNWYGVFEVRGFRITLTKDGSLWLQSPSYSRYDWAKCFIVADKDQWHELQNKVITQFRLELDQRIKEGIYARDILDSLIENAKVDYISEADLKEISNNIH